ncbi:bifunctional nuclease domain-containing protein [uncultured Bacteroides sp.]|uniref:bifunctional nuclease domain-containing protein n=1 Tax=uncultured Bacteroides sp. TaxID=162156 RepID=UPI002AAA813F|nr:bifunctional nuclease domain-containing protein [uncultured Bacteroides sp.]
MSKKIELKILDVYNTQAQAANAYVLILEELGGERQLPVIIGPGEAHSILFNLKKIDSPRPLTHDLFALTLEKFHITLTEIFIYRVEEGIFYAYLFLKEAEQEYKIDARTSDAVALAIRLHAPVYIDESVLEAECLTAERESQKDIREESLQTLKEALSKAIENENYELAAMIRDEILRRE